MATDGTFPRTVVKRCPVLRVSTVMKLSPQLLRLWSASLCLLGCSLNASAAEPFALRGYYLTFMRMPVMGLKEWKEAVDCFTEDDVNVLILWTAGGFRSKEFPITWQYNQEHHNVTNDFMRELIDYAHTKKIRVL